MLTPEWKNPRLSLPWCVEGIWQPRSRIGENVMSQPEQCELCSARAVPLHERCGANVCRSCLTLLWFDEVLLESDATEAEIVPTLAFARHADALWTIRNPQQREAAAHQLVERYAALELVDVVSGVPMLRMKPAFVEVVRYEGSNLAKRIRIRVLSRFAEPQAMAELYWDICKHEGLPRHKTSPGSLSWDFDRMHMVVDVGPREDIHPARLHQHAEYPQVRRFAFPLDTVVQELLRALLGQGQDKNLIFARLRNRRCGPTWTGGGRLGCPSSQHTSLPEQHLVPEFTPHQYHRLPYKTSPLQPSPRPLPAVREIRTASLGDFSDGHRCWPGWSGLPVDHCRSPSLPPL